MSAIDRRSILPGNIRDASYVAANMRPHDWREIAAQAPDDLRPLDVAAWSIAGREAYIAIARDRPVSVFGVHDATPAGNVLSIWAWGTAGMWRAVPGITRWIRTAVPRWIDEGVTRVEARSIVGHTAAHRWMRSLGARETELPAFGRGGEDFILFWWTRETWARSED